jgi:twinkle protein
MPGSIDLQKLIEFAVEQAAAQYFPDGSGEGNSIKKPSDLIEKALHVYDQGLPRGEYCGWPVFDDYYRPRRGEWTVITGIPRHGKTTFFDAMMANLHLKSGWNFAVFSAEQRPIERHLISLISKVSGFPVFDGYHQRISREYFSDWVQKIENGFYFLDPQEDSRNLNTILAMTNSLVDKKLIDGLVIDPWNELDHTRPVWMNETEFVSVCLSKLRTFAREKNIHIWLIAHPAKLYRDKEGNLPVPDLYSISGSAHFFNKSDNGLVVWRNEQDPKSPTRVYIQKIRFQENGQLGMVEFNFDKATGIYSSIGAGQ